MMELIYVIKFLQGFVQESRFKNLFFILSMLMRCFISFIIGIFLVDWLRYWEISFFKHTRWCCSRKYISTISKDPTIRSSGRNFFELNSSSSRMGRRNTKIPKPGLANHQIRIWFVFSPELFHYIYIIFYRKLSLFNFMNLFNHSSISFWQS